jgi:RND family efflux transporter MFP subunit
LNRRFWLLLLSVSLLQACSETKTAPTPAAEPTAIPAQTTIVQPGSWTHSFKSYGLVTPAEEYEIGVEVSATVEKVLFREGQAVQVGDILIQLDDKKLRLRLEGAKASVEEARASHQQAKSTHERNRSIFESGVISEQAYLASEAQFKSSQANLRRALSAFDISEEELADAEVHSPVNGVVTRRDVESGQTVSPASRLGVIRVMDALRVETFVSQKDINHVSVGMTAKVTSPGVPGQEFVGRVDQVSSSAEVATGNFEVGVVVEDSANLLRDGMSAMVEFRSAEQAHTLAVPRKALVDRGRRLIVYRMEGDVARAVEPSLGVGNADSVPVFSGLNAGDEVVISNLRLVSDGQQIERLAPDEPVSQPPVSDVQQAQQAKQAQQANTAEG